MNFNGKIIRIIFLSIIMLSSISIAFANLNISNGRFKAVGAINVKILGELKLANSANLTLSGSPTINLTEDWNIEGNFSPDEGRVVFSGTVNQNINAGATASFYDLEIDKPTGDITFDDNSNLSISNDLIFAVDNEALILSRQNRFVAVEGNVIRNGNGFVDGELRQLFATGDLASYIFHIGRDSDYTPVELDINGAGGVAGFLSSISNDRTIDIAPSQINPQQNIEREYVVNIPIGSTFELGSREFDITFTFINPDDIRNSADPNNFRVNVFDGNFWAEELLDQGALTANSTQAINVNLFGRFLVGPEAPFLTFFTRENGLWNIANNWSLYEFGGIASSISPRPQDVVNIGNNNTIELDADKNTTSTGEINLIKGGLLNEPGTLILGEFVISGDGTFNLDEEGTLSIGSAGGISLSPSLTGGIQTVNRNYNIGNHNSGNFVFTNSAVGILGDGLPSTVSQLSINNSAVVSISANLNIAQNLNIVAGALDLADFSIDGGTTAAFNINDGSEIFIGGTNSILLALPDFTSYSMNINSTFEFNGSDQTISAVPANFFDNSDFGNIRVSEAGNKTINAGIIVRGNLSVSENAILINEVGNQLDVWGQVVISSQLSNLGELNIGN